MDESGCSACISVETREHVLRPAARDPALKGSRFVGSRGVRDLSVCRDCGAMWQTWNDQREDYQCWRAHGRSIVPAFAADTSLTRLVGWVASDYTASSFGLIDALATKLIRRKPEGLQDGTSALFHSFRELIPPNDVDGAGRLTMLFSLLGLVVERVIRGDLRPAGPRVKPPTQYRDAEVEKAARQFRPRTVGDLTRLPKTHDVIRRLMWESRWGGGADSPDDAVIAIHDPSPLLEFLEELPLDNVDDGVQRGLCAEAAFTAAGKLNNRGRLPENDHAIWMPEASWIALEKLVDPLERLAASFQRIQLAVARVPSECLLCNQMESILVREPIRNGARFTDHARRDLEEIARRLGAGRSSNSASAHEALRSILDLEKKATEADARCVLA